MELLSKDIVDLLTYLLPGFFAAWIYYGLTAAIKPAPLERIIQALIFTVLIRFIYNIIERLCLHIGESLFILGPWNSDTKTVVLIITTAGIGILFSSFAQYDFMFRLLRKLRFTNKTPYPDEWYGSFITKKTYVILHFYDGRRIYGWPLQWPTQPEKGHFELSLAEWLTETDNKIKLDSVDSILIPAKEIKFVEFMALKNGSEDEE